MPTYDRGSAPIPEPKKPIQPAPKPFTPQEGDEPIVQCAHELIGEDQQAQPQRQTQGRQAGFTEASVDGIRQKDAGKTPAKTDNEAATAFQPDDDGYVPDLPDEETVYPAPTKDLPPDTVVLAELDEK